MIRTFPLPDDQAQVYGEAVMGLSRAAVALPLESLSAWLNVERAALLRGEQGATGADPRRVEQLMMICDALTLAALRVIEFDRLMNELEAEAAQQAADEQAARPFVAEFPSRHPTGRAWTREEFEALSAVWPNPDGTPREAEREAAGTYGDRRDEPIPDDWAV